jgi:hypothetical protein
MSKPTRYDPRSFWFVIARKPNKDVGLYSFQSREDAREFVDESPNRPFGPVAVAKSPLEQIAPMMYQALQHLVLTTGTPAEGLAKAFAEAVLAVACKEPRLPAACRITKNWLMYDRVQPEWDPDTTLVGQLRTGLAAVG